MIGRKRIFIILTKTNWQNFSWRYGESVLGIREFFT